MEAGKPWATQWYSRTGRINFTILFSGCEVLGQSQWRLTTVMYLNMEGSQTLDRAFDRQEQGNKVWCTHGKDMTFIHKPQIIKPFIASQRCRLTWQCHCFQKGHTAGCSLLWWFAEDSFEFSERASLAIRSDQGWASAVGPSTGPTCTWKGEEDVPSTGAGAFGLELKPWRSITCVFASHNATIGYNPTKSLWLQRGASAVVSVALFGGHKGQRSWYRP